jgi:hypothetical protein
MAGAGNDGCTGGRRERKETIPGGLDEGSALEGEIEEELWVIFTREGPETGASTTGGDDNVETGYIPGESWGVGEDIVTEGRGMMGGCIEEDRDMGRETGAEERRLCTKLGAGGGLRGDEAGGVGSAVGLEGRWAGERERRGAG